MLFRWSLYGEKKPVLVEMLRDSISSFRRFYGNGPEYLVLTDEAGVIEPYIQSLAKVEVFDKFGENQFNSEAKTQWRKWSPKARLAFGMTEIYVDIDVFCVGEPWEIKEFCHTPGDSICGMQESLPNRHCYGVFGRNLKFGLLPINAGLVIQQSQADIHERLKQLFTWWQQTIPIEKRKYEDEQGAVAQVFTEASRFNKTFLLPKNRYLITSPRTNPNLSSLIGLAVIHTTQQQHPKYYEFRSEIRSMIEKVG